MKVNIETQALCRPRHRLRGIPYYAINLIEELVRRNQNEYSISFFDYNKEQNYRQNMYDFIAADVMKQLDIYECNSLSYDTILNANKASDMSVYAKEPYSHYIGGTADVYHFPNPFEVPFNVDGKTVVTIHDCIAMMQNIQFNENSRKAFQATIDFLELREEIAIVTDSQSVKDDLMNLTTIKSSRIHVAPLAYDTQIHYPQKDDAVLRELGIDGPFILYLGVLDFRKGIVNILNAFEIIKPMFPDLKLVLAGDLNPFVTSIPERLDGYRYIDDVIRTGFVSDEQKRVLLSSAEVFLFPSEYEGFGIPVLEAMACGSPVITTNVSSLPEVGGDAALYVTPKQPEELAEAIQKILESDSLRSSLIEKGFVQTKQFSWSRTAEMMEKVYRCL